MLYKQLSAAAVLAKDYFRAEILARHISVIGSTIALHTQIGPVAHPVIAADGDSAEGPGVAANRQGCAITLKVRRRHVIIDDAKVSAAYDLNVAITAVFKANYQCPTKGACYVRGIKRSICV